MKKTLLKTFTFLLTLGVMPVIAQDASPSFGYSIIWEYNANPDFTQLELKADFGSGTLSSIITINYVKDANNDVVSSETTSSFFPVSRSTKTDSGNQRIYTTEEETAPNSGVFELSRRETYFKDVAGDTTVILEEYDDNVSAFVFRNKVLIQRNTSGAVTQYTNYYHDGSNWILTGKDITLYDGNDLPLSDTSYAWNGTTFEVDGYGTYTNTGGKRDYYIEYNYDFNLSAFVEDEKMVFTVDANGYTTEVLGQEWDENTMTWVDDLAFVMGYGGPSSITEMSTSINQLEVYPNPATNQIQLTLNEDLNDALIQITTVDGKVVQEFQNTIFTASQAINLNINNLASGFYLVKVISNQNARIAKFLKN